MKMSMEMIKMAEVTGENQIDEESFEDAFDVIEYLGHGLDFEWRATEKRWKVLLNQTTYDLIRHDPDGYVYEKDGQEFIKVFDHQSFRIHMRIAGIDDSIPAYLGCRRQVDEEQCLRSDGAG